MHKPVISTLVTALLHFAAVLALYLLLILALDNRTTLILQMSAQNSASLQPEIYYTREGEPFTDAKMISSEKRNGTLYYFTLPPFDSFNYIRLDPTKKRQKITIDNDILIVTSHWFTKQVFKADIKKAQPSYQIAHYSITKNGIAFETTGNDPQLNLNLSHTLLYSTKDYHIERALLALILYLSILFLYKTFKGTAPNNYIVSKLILYALFLSLSFLKVNYYKEHVRFIYTPDVVAHFSYVRDMTVEPTLIPEFEHMYMVTNKNAGNYLGHPPLYYLLMSLAYDNKSTSVRNMDHMQSVNMMLFLLSMLLLCYMVFKSNMPILGHFTYLSIIVSIPMHAYLGAALTNDNLAFLGGVLFLAGLKRFIDKEDMAGYVLLLAGIFIAFFSKLTAALLIFFALVYLLGYYYKKRSLPHLNRWHIILLVLTAVPIVLYQLHILFHYHAIIPTLNVTHPQEYLHSVYYIPEEKRHYMTFGQWLELYWHGIQSGWFGIHSHHSLYKHHISGYIGLFALHIMALVALFFPCNERERALCITGKLALLALFSVALIQLLFGYKTHLHSGYTGGLQPRYLLPFMVGFAIMATIFVNKFNKSFLFTIAVIILCIHAIYSDFFYFIQYYR